MDNESATIVNSLMKGRNVLLLGASKGQMDGVIQTVKAEIGPVLGPKVVIAQDISAHDALMQMIDNSDMLLLASLTNAHLFGVSVSFVKALETRFPTDSNARGRLLEQALECVQLVGPGKSSFREKMREARYNQERKRDHGQLLRGWSRDVEHFDPGWELDR